MHCNIFKNCKMLIKYMSKSYNNVSKLVYFHRINNKYPEVDLKERFNAKLMQCYQQQRVPYYNVLLIIDSMSTNSQHSDEVPDLRQMNLYNCNTI